LVVPTLPIRDGARQILARQPRSARPLDGEPKAIFDEAAQYPKAQPFSEVFALRSRLTAAMRDELSTNGRTPAYAMMSDLLGRLHGALDPAISRQASEESAAVRTGAMAPGDTMAARLGQWADGLRGDAQRSQAAAGRNGAANPGNLPGGRSNAGRGAAGTAGQAGTRSGNNAGTAGVSGGAGKPQSLLGFLVSKGGIKEESGELRSVEAIRNRPGLVNNRSGLSHDYAREAANEAGFGPFADTSEFRKAVQEEVLGRRQYRQGDAGEGLFNDQARRDENGNEAAYEQARNRILMAEDESGERMSTAEIEHATLLHMHGLTPFEALRNAAEGTAQETLDREAQKNGFNPSAGMPLGVRQSEMPVGGGDRLTPNWDEAASERDKAAQAGWAEHFGTYRSAPGVGEVLAPGRTSGEFRIGSSRVPSLLISGKGAAERIQAFLRAGGQRQSLIDYAAYDLRRFSTLADDTLDPAKSAAWLKANSEAATILPELKTMGTDAVAARRAYEEANVRAKEARDAAADVAKREFQAATQKRAQDAQAFQRSAAGKLLGDADPVAAIGRMLRGDTAVADMRRLYAMTSGSVSARMGLRRAVAEFMARELRGVTLAGETGETAFKSAAFQTFMRKAGPALREIFPAEQMNALQDIADDLQRSAKSMGTKLPGGSNTAQDIYGMTKGALKSPSVIAQIVGAEAAGMAMGAPGIGSLGGFGALVLSVMKKAGMQKVDDLVAEAMLNPDLAKALLLRPLSSGQTRALSILRQRLRSVPLVAAATSERDERKRTGTGG
jgi:hypothetical protein